MLAFIFAYLLQSANGQYSSITQAAAVAEREVTYKESESDKGYTKPTAPVAPPRIQIRDGPSIGYLTPPPPIRRHAKSSGKCSFADELVKCFQSSLFADKNSWRFEPQTAVANAVMFERITGSTCDKCVKKCLRFQDPSSEWMCRSLTFDHRWKICDLFAVNGTSPPHFLTEYVDRDYLEYLQTDLTSDVYSTRHSTITPVTNSKESNYLITSTEVIETTSEPTSLSDYQPVNKKLANKSSGKFCKNEDVTRYMMILNHERQHSVADTKVVKAESLKDCAKVCDRDETLTCASVIHKDNECELSASKATHKSSDEFISKESSTYLEKFCFSASLAEATEILWPTVLDHILVGHVMEVVDAPSLAECMNACLKAEQEFSFVCQSAMWYPNDEDQNCLLNTESRETHPNVFVAEDQGVRMFYFEVPRVRHRKGTDVLRDDPVEDDYTRWSSCNDSNLQHRYLKCKEQADVRKCPRQTKFCKLALNKLWKGKCTAVRDSSGRKKCPHGIRTIAGGHVEYCKNPIDCGL